MVFDRLRLTCIHRSRNSLVVFLTQYKALATKPDVPLRTPSCHATHCWMPLEYVEYARRVSLLRSPTCSQTLIEENHAHLCTLEVSHASLEAIKAKTALYDLHTKLTGAGGGGCAITLIPDGKYMRREFLSNCLILIVSSSWRL